MGWACFSYLTSFRSTIQSAYANVYDVMFSFFRNGNDQLVRLLKLELDNRLIEPFTTKMESLRTSLEDITFAAQIAFFISTMLAVIVV